MQKKILVVFIFIYTLTGYANLAFAQISVTDYSKAGVSDQIRLYLCTPTKAGPGQNDYKASGAVTGNTIEYAGANNQASGDLYNCINRLYRFAIVIASVIGVFFIVIAGYLYMSSDGNQESVDKAKSILASSITSLVILFGGYVLLKAINPDLIQFRSIQPPSVKLDRATISPASLLNPTGGVGGTPSTDMQTLANLIKNNGNVSLLSQHVDPNTQGPESTAAQNIADVSSGKAAKCSQAVTNCSDAANKETLLDNRMLNAINIFGKEFGKIRVTTIAGGIHSANSRHYKGKAFDVDMITSIQVRTLNTTEAGKATIQRYMDKCKELGATEVLGPLNQSDGHPNHVHCAW